MLCLMTCEKLGFDLAFIRERSDGASNNIMSKVIFLICQIYLFHSWLIILVIGEDYI